jgi:hypothetical protein
MGEWSPLIVGFGYIGLIIALVALFPNAWWSRDLRRSYGIKPTGPNDSYSRRDFFRGAGVCAILSILLMGGAFLVMALAQRFPNLSLANNITAAYGFMCVLLSGLAALCSLIILWNGIRWRPSTDSSDIDSPAV